MPNYMRLFGESQEKGRKTNEKKFKRSPQQGGHDAETGCRVFGNDRTGLPKDRIRNTNWEN